MKIEYCTDPCSWKECVRISNPYEIHDKFNELEFMSGMMDEPTIYQNGEETSLNKLRILF